MFSSSMNWVTAGATTFANSSGQLCSPGGNLKGIDIVASLVLDKSTPPLVWTAVFWNYFEARLIIRAVACC